MEQFRLLANGTKRDPLKALLLLLAASFYLVGYVHLRADFPNHSPWNDWSKMTDEGWYGNAAIHSFVWGHWYLKDSFNPAVAMPVWPAMLGIWFAMTGPGMVAARALSMVLYGLSLLLLYGVIWQARPGRLAAAVVLLTAINPFCYAFDRLAILEPAAVFWMMLALWLAAKTRCGDWLRLAMVGAVLFLMMQTKFTALILVPAVLYFMWATWQFPRPQRSNWRPLLSILAVITTMTALWIGYMVLFIEPHYLLDYEYLFRINELPLVMNKIPRMAMSAVYCCRWINPILMAVGLSFVVLSWFWLRELWSVPLFGAVFLAIVGLLVFTVYRVNFQPRYYLMIAMPVGILIGLGTAALRDRITASGATAYERRLLGTIGLLLCASVLWMGTQTIGYVLRPEYSFVDAAQAIAAIMRSRPGQVPVLLSESGDDLTFWTGIRAVSEQYTPEGLDTMLKLYRPEWYAAWPQWEYRYIDDVSRRYRLKEVARYKVFDDPKRQILVLYKLSPR